MTIIAPPGCRIWLNDVPVETSLSQEMTLSIDGQRVKSSERSAGVIILKGIRPDTYQLVARKPNFQEYSTPVTVTLDTENVVSVRLTPATGKLTVSPSVGGADVEIFSLETNTTVGHYIERLDQFELAPGQYRVTASRVGYKPANREIRVNPGESVYLEPVLELLPPPPPAPKPRSIATPMSFTVQRQDKYLLFYLRGSSSDTTTTHGTITVSLNGPGNNTVIGNLNGLPCQIELIRLENIAEASVVDAPGPANNWTSMVLRVRLKDEKRRPSSFAINWRALSNATALKVDAVASDFIPAQAIRKVQPEYPMTARGSNLGGSVLVMVTIDSNGSVLSTKVIEGPDVFRRAAEDAARKWKFRPATSNGQAVESEQIVQFRFAP
jgi:TonB family protein